MSMTVYSGYTHPLAASSHYIQPFQKKTKTGKLTDGLPSRDYSQFLCHEFVKFPVKSFGD